MLYILAMCLTLLSCDLLGGAGTEATDHKMYVYSNLNQALYLVDYSTFNIVKEIPLDVPEEVSLYGMTLSTNRDYLFFWTYGPQNDSPLGFATYNIEQEQFEETYFTELKTNRAVRFIAAQDTSKPGLIYAYLRDRGTYAIDLLENEVIEQISDEHGFRLAKHFQLENDNDWILVQNKLRGDGGYEELHIFEHASNLQEPLFTLNESGRDSISIYDFELSGDAETLFLTYQLSDGRSRDIESYLGSYDLQTGQLYESDLRFPWSLNGYFIAYSAKRDEIYTAGNTGTFYIIDAATYAIKEQLTLPVPDTGAQSPILIGPDENIAFIGYMNTHSTFVIDLNKHELIDTVKFEGSYRPYLMIIP